MNIEHACSYCYSCMHACMYVHMYELCVCVCVCVCVYISYIRDKLKHREMLAHRRGCCYRARHVFRHWLHTLQVPAHASQTMHLQLLRSLCSIVCTRRESCGWAVAPCAARQMIGHFQYKNKEAHLGGALMRKIIY